MTGVFGITMVRDEVDILEFTLARLYTQGVTHIIVLDNGSVDGTREVLEERARANRFTFQGLTVIDDPEVGYYQADKMTRLARLACDLGAEWVLPFDADEYWGGADGLTIAEALRNCDADVVQVPEFKYWPTPCDQLGEPNPFLRLRWREDVQHRLFKVAFRAHPDARLHMGNHDVDRPGVRVSGVLEMRHFPYRSFDQFVRKVRNGRQAYEAATSLHRMYGTHWRTMGAESNEELLERWNAACTLSEHTDDEWLSHGPLINDPI